VIINALADIPQSLDIILFGSDCLFDPFRDVSHHTINYCHCYDLSGPIINNNDTHNGAASFAYLKTAVQYASEGKVTQLVTGPISKTAWKMAGINHTGHTTALQSLSQSSDVSMAFYTPTLKTILTTIHIPLMQVGALLTPDRLKKTIDHGQLFCQQLGINFPRIAVAGLNPHAGEGGLFGNEEEMITQVVAQYGDDITGPYPPDTLYYRASCCNDFDLVVSLYHDQGLIPIKLIGFHEAVNVTVGLPFIRTSPDHGTAFDIAGQGKANASSMRAAIVLAETLTKVTLSRNA
jgi:4-hydroxythreonine-4-phosphate dehydrogenase